MTDKVQSYGKMLRNSGIRFFQSPPWRYLVTPIIDQYGNALPKPPYAYGVQLGLSYFTEVLIRIALSFGFTIALAQFNAAVFNATETVFMKAAIFSMGLAVMGRISAYTHWENMLVSVVPSSKRMFSVDSIQPYADVIHVVTTLFLHYGGSLAGNGLALWVSNAATLNLGNPATTADAPGVIGNHSITSSDVWIIEIMGSAGITLTWLMVVVFQRGVKDHIHASIAMFIAAMFCVGFALPATGANFDFIHYLALRTVTAGTNGVNDNHRAAYIVGPIIGAIIAWVLYLVIAWLSFAINYGKPGIAGYTGDYDPLLASKRLPRIRNRRYVPLAAGENGENNYPRQTHHYKTYNNNNTAADYVNVYPQQQQQQQQHYYYTAAPSKREFKQKIRSQYPQRKQH